MSAEKPRRLGRGLDSLIPGSVTTGEPGGDLQRIPLARIRANPFQPRREFEAGDLAELEASLKASGLLQPITVRRRGEAFELIAGERRLRAATNLGWTDISAIIRDFDDRTMLVLALVENLQRTNLNAIEEARGYRRLIDEFRLTQQQVADAIGKDRTTVTNLLRVLTLPEPVQQMVEHGILSLGHARALLALGASHSVSDLANQAVARGLSVRELEQRVRELSQPSSPSETGSKGSRAVSPTSHGGGTGVRSGNSANRRRPSALSANGRQSAFLGELARKVEVSFYSNDDLERLLELILRDSRKD